MTENNPDNNKNQNEEHVPYLAPVDEQVRSGNMGVYLDEKLDENEKKKRFILVIILVVTAIGLFLKGSFFDQEDQDRRRQEMIQKGQEFHKYVDEKERMAREAVP